ncbi:response regulator transcription factor [Actinoplanes sp. KI2]|uniref:helix-turn-helix domain-containing protein n=1 Tax=Actinoplanes sp. KI2 TaxID=2983315 RepID=UPI0021D5DFA8|nr:response regulator transcription factor [Actinoplanes sp. KI2]MCU7724399.1 response regulator transcription factor [Actinoplanes sp. KI2]
MAAAEAARRVRQGEREAWQAAVAAARNAAEAYPLCYCLFRLAEVERSASAAAECLRLAEELGSATATDVRALVGSGRLRPEPTGSARPRPEPAGTVPLRLTVREREVLALVTEGRSNGQIATALFISPKTASVHVSNILAKLSVSSRTEAATTAHRLGLLATG